MLSLFSSVLIDKSDILLFCEWLDLPQLESVELGEKSFSNCQSVLFESN
mgnify:CR=1 FL=1